MAPRPNLNIKKDTATHLASFLVTHNLISAEQLEQWRSAMKPVWDRFKDEIGQEVIDAALAANNP